MVVSQLGIRMDWRGRWAEVVEPGLLVDIADYCPFPGWRHEHVFEEQNGGTRMTDRVSIDVPHGLIGMVWRLSLRAVLAGMFLSRHRATHKYFSLSTTKRQ